MAAKIIRIMNPACRHISEYYSLFCAAMKIKKATIILGCITTGWFAILFIIKCLIFRQCLYTSDLITHLQISRDWLLGKPFFYENCYGHHELIHNYFFDPLMGPFTYLMNAYGIFLVLLLLMVLAAWSGLAALEKLGASFHAQIIFTIFICCPAVFYIIHNEHYGFHAEMLLFPVYILFASNLLRLRSWQYFWAVIAFMVKEESAVILLCIWLAGIFCLWELGKLSSSAAKRRALTAIIVCSLVVIAGFGWLKYLNRGLEARHDHIKDVLLYYPASDIFRSFTYLVLLRIQLTAFVILVLFIFTGWRFTLVSIILSIPVLILNFLSGIFYLENDMIMIRNFFSLLWCPRFSLYWAYWICVLMMALIYKPKGPKLNNAWRTGLVCVFGAGLFIFQEIFFKNSYVTRLSMIEVFTSPFKPNPEFIEHPEYETAVKIAEYLPVDYPVAPMYQVFGAYCKQDIVWLNSLHTAYRMPRMILASYNKNEVPPPNLIMKEPYHLQLDSLHIYSEAEDTIYIYKAGYQGRWTKIEK
jgi:hypothetical protein